VFLEDPWESLPRIKNAGAICLGEYTPAAVGDYWAGPSHVLPTGGAARFSSPLGVEDFLKKSSILFFQQDSLARARKNTALLAKVEGFTAHAHALRIREEKRYEP
jgi:histidinol dehydrogenase